MARGGCLSLDSSHFRSGILSNSRQRAQKRARQLPCGFLEVGVGHDGVPLVDTLRPVAGDLHSDGTRDGSALHVPDGRSAHVVAKTPGYASGLACCRPCPAIVLPPVASLVTRSRNEVGEDPWDDLAELALEGFHSATLGRQERLQLVGKVDEAAVVVLRFPSSSRSVPAWRSMWRH
jgi:hypothetical protein